MPSVITSSEIKIEAAKHGLSCVGCVPREVFEHFSSEERKRLAKWQAADYAGEMEYMNRADSLFFELDSFLANTKTILCFLVSYNTSKKVGPAPQGFGRVARYAWGRDYHRVIKTRLKKISESLKISNADLSARVFTDAVPLLERYIAKLGGLGFVGKNTMLIKPGAGSFTFLGEILIDSEVVDDEETRADSRQAAGAQRGSCGTCTRCLEACPTDAFTGPYSLDAGRCISYLTIEKKTSFSDWEARAVGDWLFGCDICQEVCPFNHEGIEMSDKPELGPDAGAGSYLSLRELLTIKSRIEFEMRFRGTPLMRAGYRGMLRNACAVAANTRRRELKPEIAALLASDEAVIKQSAEQALVRLS